MCVFQRLLVLSLSSAFTDSECVLSAFNYLLQGFSLVRDVQVSGGGTGSGNFGFRPDFARNTDFEKLILASKNLLTI